MHYRPVISCRQTPKRQKKKTLPGYFILERIIASMKGENELEYLVKWKDWPSSTCSWEPASHLGEELIRNFNISTPAPSRDRIDIYVGNFTNPVLSRLKSKCMNPKVSVNMDHDVYRFLAKGKGRRANNFPRALLLEKDDFSRFNMEECWWYAFDMHGEGHAVLFPIRTKPILRWSSKLYIEVNGSITLAPQKPVETVSFYIARHQRSTNNIHDL